MLERIFVKYKGLNVQAKAAIWFIFCSILQKGIKFITVPIFTRILTTEEYGVYSLYLSWFEILTIITSLYLYYGVLNNGLIKYETKRDEYISSMQGLCLTINVSIFIIYILFSSFWNEVIGLPVSVMCLMFLETLVTPALAFWSGKQRFEYKYTMLVVVTLGKCILDPIFGLVAVLSLDCNKGIARIVSIVFVEVVFCGWIMILQFFKGKKVVDLKYWKYALGLAIPLIPHYLSGTVLTQGNRILIDRLVGTSEVAIYSVAYSVGMVAQLFTTSINNSFTPWIYQKIKSKDLSNIKSTTSGLLFLVSGIIVFVILFSPELVWVFGSDEYLNAAYIIPPIAASVFFVFLYNLVAIPQFYFEKTHFLLGSSLLAAGLNIVLNYFLIRKCGYLIAGYTTLICYVIYGFGHYFISRNLIKKQMGDKTLFDLKYIVYCSVIVLGFSVFVSVLFDYLVVRILIALAIVMLLLLKRNAITKIFSKNR